MPAPRRLIFARRAGVRGEGLPSAPPRLGSSRGLARGEAMVSGITPRCPFVLRQKPYTFVWRVLL